MREKENEITAQIDGLDARLEDLQIIVNAPGPLAVLERATIPAEHDLPRWDVLLGGGAGAGLILGLLAGLFAHVASKKK